MDKASYKTAFTLIIADFKEILSFIEPVEANKPTYSHRIYELFLRTCTEFESLCKDMLIKQNYQGKPSPNKYDVNDYKTLYNSRKFHNIGLLYWHPNVEFIEPFKDWKESKPLSWYQSYNKVKHNRNNEFHRANLNNLIFSVAGLFTLIQINGCFQENQSIGFKMQGNLSVVNYYDYLHSIKRG